MKTKIKFDANNNHNGAKFNDEMKTRPNEKPPLKATDQNDAKGSFDRANIFSKLSCWYVLPFLFRHYRRNFNLDAIDTCPRFDRCERLAKRLQKHWNTELAKGDKRKASLLRALCKCFGAQFLRMNIFNLLVYGVFRMLMPIMLGRIIFYSNRYNEQKQIRNNTQNFGPQEFDMMITKSNQNTSISSTIAPEIGSPAAIEPVDSLNRFLSENLGIELDNRQNVILHSALLAALIAINLIVAHPYFFRQFRYGMNIRVGLTRLVYEKALRVTTASVQRISIGTIVNLISTDANRFDIAYIYIGFGYCALIETAIGMYLMWLYIGSAALGTLALIAVYIPFQAIMANILSRYRSKSIMLTDSRLRLMAEILPAMRVIKMYVWERPFAALVHLARRLEIGKIRQSMILRSINLALYFVAPKVMAFICLVWFMLAGGELTAERVFVTLALVAQIRDVITYMFPLAISYGVESYISLKRIEKFLLEQEIENYAQRALPTACINPSGESRIALDHVTVNSEIDGSIILKDISFEVTPGKLTVIIGPVGSGKSSILLSILKELPISKSGSRLEVVGRLIYASQEAWIFSGTIRDNILFGRDFDSARYREVVKVSALSKDLAQFENGDQTIVDDRGTSLSGGQRARISLARALYTDADCFLLDDPLSAVDAAVAKHIFDRCIKEYLRNKCVILVTHQLQFIKQADQIVVLKDGACLACGSYLELLNRGIDVFKYSSAEQEKSAESIAASQISQIDGIPSSGPDSPRILTNPANPLLRFRVDSFNSDIFRTSRTNSFVVEDADSEHDEISNKHDQLSILDSMQYTMNRDDDDLDAGGGCAGGYQQKFATAIAARSMESTESKSKNKLKIYWTYIRAGASVILFCTFMFSNLSTQVLFTGSDIWLSEWTGTIENQMMHDKYPTYEFTKSPVIADDRNTNIYIYSGIILLLFVMSIGRTVLYFVICMRSSVNLHNKIFTSLLQAPIVFFDKTPIGIIMNRVSRDLGIIDDLLPTNAFEALEILANSLGVFTLCTALNHFVAIPLVVLVIMIFVANNFYVNTARKLKRLEGVARSPLFNQMAGSLTGLPTIRSYGVEQMFIERFSDTQDLHTATYFTFLSASRIYGIFLEAVSIAFIYSMIVAMNFNLDAYTGSVIGLTISQSLMLTNTFNWGIRLYTEVETYMTSVERIVEFGALDKEELESGVVEPPQSWPSKGNIEYSNVSLRYNDTPSSSGATNNAVDDIDEGPKAVLSNLTFTINGGEKIGIVGRTGAGKSSLITTLFRLTEPTGSIRIDGIEASDISLARLRRSLSIIPQEPIMFSGNIRRNLDPFGEKSDEQLWDAIDKVQLRAKIQSLKGKLDSPVSESGCDFSVGQKQLICMARAILRRNRVLVLDEATANVDPRTDALIQATIRSEFANCTVLTIAHRLNTIIDYDRVMVLDAGTLSQFDSPYELIKRRSGIFYELYSNLNPDTKVELKRLAKKAHEERKQQLQTTTTKIS